MVYVVCTSMFGDSSVHPVEKKMSQTSKACIICHCGQKTLRKICKIIIFNHPSSKKNDHILTFRSASILLLFNMIPSVFHGTFSFLFYLLATRTKNSCSSGTIKHLFAGKKDANLAKFFVTSKITKMLQVWHFIYVYFEGGVFRYSNFSLEVKVDPKGSQGPMLNVCDISIEDHCIQTAHYDLPLFSYSIGVASGKQVWIFFTIACSLSSYLSQPFAGQGAFYIFLHLSFSSHSIHYAFQNCETQTAWP